MGPLLPHSVGGPVSNTYSQNAPEALTTAPQLALGLQLAEHWPSLGTSYWPPLLQNPRNKGISGLLTGPQGSSLSPQPLPSLGGLASSNTASGKAGRALGICWETDLSPGL